MQKKAAVFLGVAVLALAGIGWFGWKVWQEIEHTPGSSIDGPALKIDVVAPKEPEAIRSDGQLSVGELANGYDHSQTMQRNTSPENGDDYTSWDDQNWSGDSDTGVDGGDKRVMKSNPKDAGETGVTGKVPSDY